MSILCLKAEYNKTNSETELSGEYSQFIPCEKERAYLLSIHPEWNIEPCYMPSRYKNICEAIYNFEVRPDDIWVISYAKCGTTWTQEMTWMLQTNEAPNKTLIDRYHFMEMSVFSTDNIVNFFAEASTAVAEMPSPRFIKTHLPIGLLPKQLWTVKPKIVYVSRNIKDTAISYFHHMNNLQGYTGTLDQFLEGMLNDQQLYSPFHSHVTNFWSIRNFPNVCFLTFEEMKADLFSVVQRVAQFLGKSYTEQRLKEITENLGFKKMKENVHTNNEPLVQAARSLMRSDHIWGDEFKFMREGAVGGYQKEMTPEFTERFNQWTAEKMKHSDFKFVI